MADDSWIIGTLLVVFWTVGLGSGVVCGMKGTFGVLAPVLLFGTSAWIVGACRFAKPDSYRARRFYAANKLRRAALRAPVDDGVERGPI